MSSRGEKCYEPSFVQMTLHEGVQGLYEFYNNIYNKCWKICLPPCRAKIMFVVLFSCLLR